MHHELHKAAAVSLHFSNTGRRRDVKGAALKMRQFYGDTAELLAAASCFETGYREHHRAETYASPVGVVLVLVF